MINDYRVGVSIGTASLLGLVNAKMDVPPNTGHFLVGTDHCIEDCAFCSRARSSRGLPKRLSRVTWPEFPAQEVLSRLHEAIRDDRLKRVCVQVVEGATGTGLAVAFAKDARDAFVKSGKVPLISVCALPYSVSRVSMFLENGASNVGLPLDGANSEIYRAVKKRDLETARRVLLEAAQRYPGRISTHLIAGLGENEEDVVRTAAWSLERGITVALFAFTPVKGTPLEGRPQPDVGSYRRIQIALDYLRATRDLNGILMEGGKVMSVAPEDWSFRERVLSGIPFQTSGCSFCNRPYYNERPGGVMYNYPRPLTQSETREAVRESGLLYFL